MIEDGGLEAALKDRYAGWEAPEAQAMLAGDLETIAARVDREGLDPQPRSGRQERLENWVNRFV
jgi:xylose isomerase